MSPLLLSWRSRKFRKDLYEAAGSRRCREDQKFFYITVPQVKQMFFVTMILTVVGAFTVFNEPYILTGGGPGTATMVLSLHMYQTGFIKNNMGCASAIAMLTLCDPQLCYLLCSSSAMVQKGGTLMAKNN